MYEGERKLLSCEGGHNSKRPKFILEEIIRFFCKNLVYENEDYENIVINSEVNENKESKKNNENKKKIKRSDS